jgi:hypothetical protein
MQSFLPLKYLACKRLLLAAGSYCRLLLNTLILQAQHFAARAFTVFNLPDYAFTAQSNGAGDSGGAVTAASFAVVAKRSPASANGNNNSSSSASNSGHYRGSSKSGGSASNNSSHLRIALEDVLRLGAVTPSTLALEVI